MFVGELNIDDSLGRKLNRNGNGMLYKFRCKMAGCDRVFGVARAKMSTHNGFCKVHEAELRMARRWKEDFKVEKFTAQHVHKQLIASAKQAKRRMTISLEEMECLTETTCCAYCDDDIPWFVTPAHFLDRIDNDLGYEVGNVAVCCPLCSHTRGDRYDAHEMRMLGKVIKIIREARKLLHEKVPQRID